MKLSQARRAAAAALRAAGIEGGARDADRILAAILGFAPQRLRLVDDRDLNPVEIARLDRDIAARAARQGSDTDLALVDTIFRKMEAAHGKRDPTREAELDADFHMAIVEASHNVIMLHMMRSMMDLLREGVFFNRSVMFQQRTTRSLLLDQHRAINDPLQARDPDAARRAVETHLNYVRASLADQREADRNEGVARQRLQQETGR